MALKLVRDFSYWNPFIHDGRLHKDATNPSPSVKRFYMPWHICTNVLVPLVEKLCYIDYPNWCVFLKWSYVVQ